jgi:protein transport protein SEC23
VSVVLDLFACSLDQVGAAELREPVECSGGFMILAESFESDQFKKCLRHLFKHDGDGFLKMNFDATIEIVTTKDVKISGALGPCVSLRKKNASVSETEVGQGGTYVWKLNTLTDRTCIAFFFQMSDEQKIQPSSAFLVQFITRYRQGNMGLRKRVTTAARRWVANHSTDIAAGFDQEAAASVMARLAILRAETCHARDVVRWLDDTLIRFTSKFGDYVPEDPSSFRLSSNFSLYPQFMFHLRRSQFIDVSNTTPDETAYFRLMLNREGVVSSLIMIQPTLFQYSFDGPPVPVLLDIRSICPDSILLFDSFFLVVIHYGSKIAQWRKLGYEKDPNHENFRKLLEAPELDAEQLVAERVPVPKIIRCDQHSSQARFLLAKLNPSVTQNSTYTDGSDIIFTDDLSLQVFLDQLQILAVQG